MSIQFGDILKHNNLLYPIVDINDVKGGLRSIVTFGTASLVSEYTSIPEKYRTGYSLLLETSTGTIYYLSGIDATNPSHWNTIGIGGNGYGIPNTIPKWTNSSTLGNSNITDNGDTVIISGNLMVVGTTSTISTENLLVKDPIILLAGSQSGTPTYDAGLFVNRGSSTTQAFIWDESETEFKFISTTSGATVSGDVTIGTYSSVRTGVLSVGTGTSSDSRFLVSSSGGTTSLVVDDAGNVYNISRGITNTLFGYKSLLSNSGSNNTALGALSLINNTTGGSNTSIGSNTLYSNTTGSYNVALGDQVLYNNTTGNYNNSFGFQSLINNTTGNRNNSFGFQSLYTNTTGIYNNAFGYKSSQYNTTGERNVSIGDHSLRYNRGKWNTAIGGSALYSSTTAILTLSATFSPGSGYTPGTYSNVALWYQSGTYWNSPNSEIEEFATATIIVGTGGTVSSVTLKQRGVLFTDNTTRFYVQTGADSYHLGTASGSGFSIGIGSVGISEDNTALGYGALYKLKIGASNIGIGMWAGWNDSIGNNLEVVDSSIFIGQNTSALSNSGVNEIVIGYSTIGNGSNSVTLGNDSITKTYLKGAVYVGTATIDSNDKLVVSSGGIASLIVDSNGSVYNRGKGSISTNTVFGASALSVNTTGYSTTAIGVNALLNNTTGIYNTAIGANSLYSSNGDHNTAVGANSLYLNTNGRENTALGNETLYNNTTGGYNTAVGYQSLFNNTIGLYNTAVGKYTLYNNTTGEGNTSFGHGALYLNNGSYNTALGYHAGYSATNSNYSIFIGHYVDATSSDYSNFLGYFAGFETQLAHYSNFIGYYAGAGANDANNSNFFGYAAGQNATDASHSNLFGFSAGKSFTSNIIGSNNIVIGTNISLPNGASNSINIGGVLFGLNTYSDNTSFNPSIAAQTDGRIGINVVNPTANLHIGASTTAAALMRLEVGSAPTSPNDGDIWLESNTVTGLKIQIGGLTKTITIT